MSSQVLAIEHVISDPQVRQGRPVLAGTTLRVSDLAAYHTMEGLTADELAAQFEIDLGHVYAALAYYYDHKAEIDGELRANADQAEGWKRQLIAQGRGTAL